MIDLQPHASGVILPVRALPGAKKNELRGEQEGALKVSVTAAPEDGKANKAIVELLAKKLKLRKSQLEIISGQTSRQKKVLVADVELTDLQEKIAAVLESG
ncbi:DUF167 domain-containing protein [Blastopirellula sp. JC732]|uniref:UPF0235 protein LOC68_01190 n=1 Tax=Blastopirellula sediminis TaxID=2894196 RepID=A0A9X1MHG0_9BACT|nr:DUF167 domain-containing protein [Blastopirellula sediminis]MCC9608198.1 DUF167 domain-containing protein [Blastopirellula sediminis]MCC9627009.1 DUF167 domain-containing protein [Blastopirellula sediminis]